MEKSVTYVDLISVGLLAVNIMWGIFNATSARSYEAKQKYAPLLIDKIFSPFYSTIECRLFIKVTANNKKIILKNLNKLYKTLECEDLLFYISEDLLLSLDYLVKNPRCSVKKFSKRYQRFSYAYSKELSRARKVVGLKPRTVKFRAHFNLYDNRFSIFVSKHPVYFALIYFASWFLFAIIFVLITNLRK